jgi:hypothetical protein
MRWKGFQDITWGGIRYNGWPLAQEEAYKEVVWGGILTRTTLVGCCPASATPVAGSCWPDCLHPQRVIANAMPWRICSST